MSPSAQPATSRRQPAVTKKSLETDKVLNAYASLAFWNELASLDEKLGKVFKKSDQSAGQILMKIKRGGNITRCLISEMAEGFLVDPQGPLYLQYDGARSEVRFSQTYGGTQIFNRGDVLPASAITNFGQILIDIDRAIKARKLKTAAESIHHPWHDRPATRKAWENACVYEPKR